MQVEVRDTDIDNVLDQTNVEFLSNQATEDRPKVLSHVFRSIFVEIPRDFISGIWNFVKRYFKHYIESFKYFNKPSLKVPPFDKKDFKENTQHSFEIALIFTAILIFLIKQGAIPVNEHLQEQYGNDLMQMFFELVIFVVFAIAYFALILVSVITGRLFRFLFRVPVTRGEGDILFAYLNNSFFSISALLAFIFRCSFQFEQIEGTSTVNAIFGFCILLSFSLSTWWSIKFAQLNRISIIRRIIFHIISIAWFTILFGIGMGAICFFIIGA